VGVNVHHVEYDIESVTREMLRVGLPMTLAEALLSA
jgi:hypothetical protein